jgi:hypothetical protein
MGAEGRRYQPNPSRSWKEIAMSTININDLRTDLEAFPEIGGKLRSAVFAQEGDRELINAAQKASWVSAYTSAYKLAGGCDYIASYGARLIGKEIATEDRLDLETTKFMLSAFLGKMVSWSVGPRDENKQITLLPGQTGWMHIVTQNGEVLRSRKATAEDFENAPAFSINSPALATKMWHRVGALHLDWTTRHEAGQEITDSLPEIPAKAAVKPAKNSKARNRGRRGSTKGKR